MPETVNFLLENGPHIALFEAMIAAADKAGVPITDMFRLPASGEEREHAVVCVTVNGVEVPFVEQVGAIFSRMHLAYEAHVKSAAAELLSTTRFAQLSELLQNLEWKVKEEIERL